MGVFFIYKKAKGVGYLLRVVVWKPDIKLGTSRKYAKVDTVQ